MRKISLLLFVLFSLQPCCLAQTRVQLRIDSLLVTLRRTNEDKAKVKIYERIISEYADINSPEALKYEKPALELAQKIGWKHGFASIKVYVGRSHWRAGRFDDALKNHFEALNIYDREGDSSNAVRALTFIGQDYADGGDYPKALSYFSKVLRKQLEIGDKEGMASTCLLFSWVHEKQGDYAQSSKANFEAMKLFEQVGDRYGAGVAMINMALDFQKLGNYREALKYSSMGARTMDEIDEKHNLAGAYGVMGSIYLEMRSYAEAISHYTMASDVARSVNDQIELGMALSGIGQTHQAQGDVRQALRSYLLAAEAYRSVSGKQLLSELYSDIGICYTRLGDTSEAKKYVDGALALSRQLDSKISLNNYYRSAELLDSATGDWKNAYHHYKFYIVGRDSIFNKENVKKLLSVQLQYEFEKKEAAAKAEQEKKDAIALKELQKQKLIRNSFIGCFAGTLLFAGIIFYQRNRIRKGKMRSDELLLNILPSEVAEELKEKGSADARQFDQVTVLFTDFRNFTSLSEHLLPQELVNEINYCYSAFDKIISAHEIEKIKTIGDAYMCAGGLPVPNKTNAEDTVMAAIEIRDFMLREKKIRETSGRTFFEVRIGLHTGPVVAGIVGLKKFAYDIWGDTVNIAARMESSGESGRINISGATYGLVKEKFSCTHRGKIEAKNKGLIDMYFVEPL